MLIHQNNIILINKRKYLVTLAMILKLFDSLTPLDQLLLKCASVIGETVNRHMLESLMSITPKREIGLGKTRLLFTI